MKVLIADDDIISCKVLEKDVKEWGYDVFTAKNGNEAFQVLKNEEIRLAVLDWMMPGIDGVDLCQKIRREIQERKSQYIYIILTTGRDQENDIIQGLSAGADDYVIKPFNSLELKIHIQNGERILELEDSRVDLASVDSLTKAWSHKKIIEFLIEELERGLRENHPTGIIMLNIDYLKEINDSYGHSAGGLVLKEIASRIKRSIRLYDRVGRYGGDEMLIVLPNCSLAEVKKIAERIRLVICEREIYTQMGLLGITVSLGGASSENLFHAQAEDLIQDSVKALHTAKKNGRNRSEFIEISHV